MRIGMILDAPFPIDPRVSNEASALISAGHEVYLFCLSYSKEFIEKEVIDSINIKTLFLCLCNRKCEIIVLFRPLTLNQKCYVYLLSLMGSKLKFHNFNLEILPKIYKKTHKRVSF